MLGGRQHKWQLSCVNNSLEGTGREAYIVVISIKILRKLISDECFLNQITAHDACEALYNFA